MALRTEKGPCRALSTDGRCEIYHDRPLVCAVYPVGGPDCLQSIQQMRTPSEYAHIRDSWDPPIIHESVHASN